MMRKEKKNLLSQSGVCCAKIRTALRSGRFTLLLLPLIGSITVSWEPSTSPDLKGYKVYIGTAPGEYFRIHDVGATTETTFADLSETKRYYFVVTAYDSLGNESRFSEEVSAIINPQAEAADIKHSYNFPNPFNPELEGTYVRYFLDDAGPVTVRIYSIDNVLIRTLLDNEQQVAGEHNNLYWNGRDDSGRPVVNGIYFGRISKPGGADIIKIAVVRK